MNRSAMNKEAITPIEKVRVIGVFAHVDAGKTTTSEAILYYTGRIHRVGSVDEGSTQLDWMKQERERGITVTSAATTCYWRGHRINLIDTPGHIDFSAEVVRSIRVIDGAVIVLCGVGGVEPQSEAVWIHADRENLPRIIFVNKLDRVGSDFDRVLGEIREKLTRNALPVQLPVGRQGNFRGVVDIIGRRALIWQDGADAPTVEPVPSPMEAHVDSARAVLLDTICETDDALLERHLRGEEPSEAELKAALRKAVVAGRLVPVLCGSALRRVGVQPLLDAVVEYLPSPPDMPPVRGVAPGDPSQVIERPDRSDAPFCAAAFKIVTDPYMGHMTWVRVFSGELRAGNMVYNPRVGAEERVARMYRMHANRREQVDQMSPSDVVALVGVKSAVTGDTLCDPDHPIELEGFKFPAPVIVVALTPPSEEEREKLHRAVGRLCNEDPTLVADFDPQTGQETLAGMGELHLEISVDRLRTEFGIAPRVSRPQVSYRETVRRVAESTGTYRKQTGGHGHYAQVRLRVEPLERGKGLVFENATTPPGGAPGRRRARRAGIPAQFVRPIEHGVREALAEGKLAGYPVTDVRVTLVGGKFHEVDSASVDFQIAGSMAMRDALIHAQSALLEPIMRIDVNVSEEYLGVVAADIGRRRGRIKGMNVRGDVRVVTGEVPLAEVRGYATDLRSLTRGRSTFVLEFVHYDFTPEQIAKAVINRAQPDG